MIARAVGSQMAAAVAIYKARVLTAYVGVEATELSLAKGDIVEVEETNENGWSLVRFGTKYGYAPADYLEKIIEAAKPAAAASAAAAAAAPSKTAEKPAAPKQKPLTAYQKLAYGLADDGTAAGAALAAGAAASVVKVVVKPAVPTPVGSAPQSIQYGSGDFSKDPNYKRCKKCNRYIILADLKSGKLKGQCKYHSGTPDLDASSGKVLWTCCKGEKKGLVLGGGYSPAPGCSFGDHDQ